MQMHDAGYTMVYLEHYVCMWQLSDWCILFTLRISDIWLQGSLGYSLFPQMSRCGEGKAPDSPFAIDIFTVFM